MEPRLTAKPIAIAADHRGVALKALLKAWLAAQGYAAHDCGTDSAVERVDAMDYALAAVAELKHGRSDFAVALCGSGQMMAMTANRFPFIRATLLHTAQEAGWARQHGDANMLVLGADTVDAATAEQILGAFLATAALGDRYAARRERLARLDICKVMTDDEPTADNSGAAPYHAHIYYSVDERARAVTLRDRFRDAGPDDPLSAILLVGDLTDRKAGPHTIPQFEIHFEERLLPLVEAELTRSGLRVLLHPLTLDDLGDHTYLGRWIGEPVELDLTVLDPPGVNQGMARFGKTDF